MNDIYFNPNIKPNMVLTNQSFHSHKHKYFDFIRKVINTGFDIYHNKESNRVARVVPTKKGYFIQILKILNYNLFVEITIFYQKGNKVEHYLNNRGYEKIC